MLRRTLTALVLVAIGLPGIIYGGVFYFVLMTIFLVGGAWEYARMYRAVHYEPHEILTVGGVLAIATARVFFVDAVMPLFVALILLAMTVHLIAFQRGAFWLAARAGVPIVPVVVDGTGSILRKKSLQIRPQETRVRLLPAVSASEVGGDERRLLALVRERMAEALAELRVHGLSNPPGRS